MIDPSLPRGAASGVGPARTVAWILVASRIALLAAGCMATGVLGSGLAVQKGNLVYHQAAPLPLEIWARWDSEWYLLIAERGYDARGVFDALPVPYEPWAACGFLPLYPLLIRLLAPIAGGVAAGVLLSNLCLAGAAALLFRLVRREVPGAAGEIAGAAACAALLLHPMSLFLSAVYAESLFLMLSIAAFERARASRFGQASICAALAAVTRPFGVLLLVPLLLEWWSQRREAAAPGHDGTAARPSSASLLWMAAIPAALGLFVLFTGRLFGNPWVFFERQERWRGPMSGPWRAFARWWEKGPAWHGAHDSTLELALAIVFIALLVPIARRMRPSYTAWAAAGILLPLGSTLWSFGRFSVTVFPAFMVMGAWWAEGRRSFLLAWMIAGATLSGLLMALYANWWWAG